MDSEVQSWVCEVIADNSGQWCANGCRFATRDEALRAGDELASRWLLVRDWRATPSADPVNYEFPVECSRPRSLRSQGGGQ